MSKRDRIELGVPRGEMTRNREETLPTNTKKQFEGSPTVGRLALNQAHVTDLRTLGRGANRARGAIKRRRLLSTVVRHSRDGRGSPGFREQQGSNLVLNQFSDG